MNILGWYRAHKSPFSSVATQAATTVVMESTEVQHREPMVVHWRADMTHALMPWQVLTHLTAIHLHHSPASLLAGLDSEALGGRMAGHLDPVHLMGSIGHKHDAGACHQAIVSARTPPGFLGV